ncbi:MAG: twin-arginine translocase TatA/TatE family subunit [Candidatus Bathyarchaeia archaeon]|nr:twin-arginine translocase TatA/TatE family subunit [Candidatus Bathyarchaeota archaeon]
MSFIGPWEIALILLIVLILFGPKKLPELAKSVGQAIREYKRASEGVLEELTPGSTAKPLTQQEKTAQGVVEEKERKALIEAAKKLGIKTEGKTIEQISEEIMKKTEETK